MTTAFTAPTEREALELRLRRKTAEYWHVWECAPWTAEHLGRCECADCAPVWQRADAIASECGRLSRLLDTLP